MGLFTFILDYAGGTYVSQITADNLDLAWSNLPKAFDSSQIAGFDLESKYSLDERLREDGPVPLEGFQNIWCATALINNELALIHLVRTVK
jgi:hypothetical protein